MTNGIAGTTGSGAAVPTARGAPIGQVPPGPGSGAAPVPEGRSLPSDNPMSGILLTLGAMAIFSCMDALSKELAARLPPLEVAWGRYLVIMALLLPNLAAGRFAALRSSFPGLQVMRGVAMTGSATLFIAALGVLPLADATAIGFVSPLFITALSIPLLGETVGIRRWSAVLVGLIGVTIVVRPGTSAFDPAALLPLASSASWAVGIIITRKMAGADSSLTTLVYSNLVGLLMAAVALPWIWVMPEPVEWLEIVGMGAFSTLAQSLLITAYRRAGASTLAPFSYSQLLWSTLFGLALFGNLPGLTTWIGGAIVVASGIYTAHREHVVHRREHAQA